MPRFFLYFGVAIACLIGMTLTGFALVLVTTPRPTDIRTCLVTQMYQVKLCPGKPGYAPLKTISPYMKAAVIASEDASFYDHQGFDWIELQASFEKNWSQGRFVRGGSTITQQLAKNVYLNAEKSLVRKLREALIVIQLEKLLSKDEILEKYLNVVEFGPGVFGVSMAARHYFSKNPASLSIAESAFLAFLLPSPIKYSASHRHKKLSPFARKQAREIVHRLWRFKKISEEDKNQAFAEIEGLFGEPLLMDAELPESETPSDEEAGDGEEPLTSPTDDELTLTDEASE